MSDPQITQISADYENEKRRYTRRLCRLAQIIKREKRSEDDGLCGEVY